MPSRTTFLAGFAAGYVLGAKAGRQRYEQITRMARGVAANPKVQQAADSLQTQAAGLAGTVKDKVTDQVQSRRSGSPDAGGYDVIEMPDPTPTTGTTTNGRMGV